MPELPQIILFATLVIAILAGGIILFMLVYQKRVANQQIQLQQLELDQQKLLIKASIQSEESERTRIAQDLHDEVAALLNTARIGFSELTETLPSNSQNFDKSQLSNKMVGEALEKIRSLSKDLKPPTLSKFGLPAGLRELCNRNGKLTGIPIYFDLKGTKKRLDPLVEISLYRVVSELLQNSIKHSNADQIKLYLEFTPSLVHIHYQDNGKGFDLESVLNSEGKGSGLRNIQTRIQAINGEIQWDSTLNEGSSAKISVNI